MTVAKAQPWRDTNSHSAQNQELVACTESAWVDAGREHMQRVYGSPEVSLCFLKEVQGHSPTTFNNTMNKVLRYDKLLIRW